MPDSPRLCAICGKRKPKRFCPGVNSDICPICCGTEREVTVACPLTCSYLVESRYHDLPPEPDSRKLPNLDISVDEAFLRRNESLMSMLALAILRASLFEGDSIVDTDVREALAALIQTYRTLESGLVYESRPGNPFAGKVVAAVQETVAQIRGYLERENARLDERDVLKVLVFFQRMEVTTATGRPKSRGFIQFLGGFIPTRALQQTSQPISPADPGDKPSGLIITP